MGILNRKALRVHIHPYIPASINYLERWLCKKAATGWKLEEVCGWKFIFRKCKPYNARYFYYSGFGTSTGISYEYLRSKEHYSCRKSTLNKTNTILYEVDVEKIDSDFQQYVILRNKFYLKHFLFLLIFSFLYTAISIVLVQFNSALKVLLIFGVISLVYSLLSVSILAYESRQEISNTGD